MRRWLLLPLILVLVATTSPAIAAAKAGAPCKKVDAVEKSGSKSFKCMKSGKKLVWKAIANEPVAPTSFDDLLANYKGIPIAAWKSSQANIASSTLATPPLEIIVGPNTKMPYEKRITQVGLKKITGVFKDFVQPPKQVSLFYNFKDLAWAKEKLSGYGNFFQVNNTFADQAVEHCPDAYFCRGAFGNYAIGTGLVINSVAEPDGMWIDYFDLSGAQDIHEFTHTIQKAQFLSANNKIHFGYPHWYSEGQSQVAGFTAGASNYANYLEMRLKVMDAPAKGLGGYTPSDISRFYKLQSQSPFDPETQLLVYTIGYITVEALAAIKGINSTMELIKDIADGKTFEQAFEQIYGTPWEKAEPILAAVVSKQFLEVRKYAPSN